MSDLTPGTKLASATCETEVIVTRPPESEVQVECGGAPMVAADDPAAGSGSPADDHADGTLVGKRYEHPDSGLELLCTKGGDGSLSVDGAAIGQKDAKPLPSSD